MNKARVAEAVRGTIKLQKRSIHPPKFCEAKLRRMKVLIARPKAAILGQLKKF